MLNLFQHLPGCDWALSTEKLNRQTLQDLPAANLVMDAQGELLCGCTKAAGFAKQKRRFSPIELYS